MPETLLVFGTDKQLCSFEHRLYHHACCILNLHHAVELHLQVLRTANVQRHTTYITLMHRTDDFSNDRVAYFISKGRQLVLRRRDQLRNHRNACTSKQLPHNVRTDVVTALRLGSRKTGDNLSDFRHIDTEEFYLGRGWRRCAHHLTQRRCQSDLIAEVDVTFLQEFCHLGTCRMQTGENGEDRLAALLNLLVQHLVGFIERCQSWRTIDDCDGIDVGESVFAIVDSHIQLFCHSRCQDVDGI